MSMTKKSRRRWIIGLSILGVFTIAVTVALNIFSAHADIYLGRGKAVVTQAEGTENLPSIYYEMDYPSYEALKEASDALVQEIEAEGMVLLKNNGALPLAETGSRVTLLGRSAADPVYGGSGSGSVDVSLAVDLRTALEDRGFTVNPVAYREIEEFASYEMRRNQVGESIRAYKNPRGHIAMDRPSQSTYDIGEMPADQYSPQALESFSDYGDAAVIVLGRPGGEGGDLTQDMKGFDENYQPGQHQLELNQDEKDLITLAKQNFDRVVVVINSSAAMELGILEDDPGVDAILWAGSPGQSGFYAVADALRGAVNPSGRTVDIYARDFTADPTFNNFGHFQYENIHGGNASGEGFFVQYREGIYYGYRYYETAAAEGFIDYDRAVVYPFGYGLSYTDFAWQITGSRMGDTEGFIEVDVQVTNTGDRFAGKDVVQLYVSPPYYPGGIEKPEVVLADFAKTGLLAPGDSEVVTLSVRVEDLASYDYEDERAYVLEEGDYGIRIQDNSHDLKEGIQELSYRVDRTVVYNGNNHRTSDQQEVTNQFDDVSALFSDSPEKGRVVNLSRADFAGTFPQAPSGDDFEASEQVIQAFQAYVASEHADPDDEMPTIKAENGLYLIDMRGVDYDDALWEVFLDQIDPADIARIVISSAYTTAPIEDLGKPMTVDLDGPAGISAFMGDIHGSAFPSAVVIASTYNTDLASEMGRMVGNEGLAYGVNGWYAPAVNIHRSPFAGRNFEYYSEDPVLSGRMATGVVEGAADKGMYTFLKHFALNDQETNRVNNGVAVWANEQAIREIYLKPFEMVVKNAATTLPYLDAESGELREKPAKASTAFMSSFNRIGGVWAGGSEPLLQTVLRDEWGFEGTVISDFNLYSHMYVNQGLAAGTDINITFDSMKSIEDSSSPTAVQHLRRSAHRLFYTVANSSAMNGFVSGTTIHYTMAPWRIWLIVADVLIGLFILFGVIRLILKSRS
ncbi:glycoside hydrolase family 3 protein [Spirochaeta lutea]|uniref:glycoside hydrolase family 3 protein n=1 Tax=Spirochaeta lutea TaxID=1480694 RepID=UPI00068ECD5E|nr:glycoside hydrolase family 3 protein [Spirochaeta lutea]